MELSKSEFNEYYRHCGYTLTQKEREIVLAIVNIILRARQDKEVNLPELIYELMDLKHGLE